MSGPPESSIDAACFWDGVYAGKDSREVSWFAPHLDTSLRLLESAGLDPGSRLIDVGGGASTLVDDLLSRGIDALTVLDVSATALAVAQQRLGPWAARVEWIAADINTAALPEMAFDFWHDRAVLHFLTDPADAQRYAVQAARAVVPGGTLLLSGFAPDGPERCSGRRVARRSAAEIEALFAADFRLLGCHRQTHLTPGGAAQSFLSVVLQKLPG
jgi:SAM-dependent methyltransferase